MWQTGSSVAAAALLSLLLPLSAAAAAEPDTPLDCARLVADGHTFDLSPLSGPHSVMHSTEQPPSLLKTTFTLDLCGPLVPDGGDEKQRCPGPTQVCAIERLINPVEDTNSIARVIPIAGALTAHSGSALSPQLTRLRTSTAPGDSAREGLRLELHGGVYAGRPQKAVVELLCDRALTGTEGGVAPQDRYKNARRDEPAANAGNVTTALTWKAYGPEGDADVLRVEWRSKYACETLADDEAAAPSAQWGFFTWFIIVAFMSTAAYLIFGSWLNYSRYGARGWDLLPHADAIRDVPYLLKDWARRVFATVQQSGERGGYSAV